MLYDRHAPPRPAQTSSLNAGTLHEAKEKRKAPYWATQGGGSQLPPPRARESSASAHARYARLAPTEILARRTSRVGKMAPPSLREPKGPLATSETKPDGEMVLPGFPDADSFVKVSRVPLGTSPSWPGAVGASERRCRAQPDARPQADSGDGAPRASPAARSAETGSGFEGGVGLMGSCLSSHVPCPRDLASPGTTWPPSQPCHARPEWPLFPL
jgi:hypothetical protein